MENIILIIVALGAFGALTAGIVLLVLYFRSGREHQHDHEKPLVYGNLVQCPRCQHMNPRDSAACLNCRLPFQPGPIYQPPAAPTYPTLPPEYQQPVAPAPSVPREASPPPADATVHKQVSPVPELPAELGAPSPAVPAPDDHPPAMPHAWLVGSDGAAKNLHVILTQDDTLIGRSTTCDVQIYDPKVSRQHLRIRYGNGAFYVQDQNSSRGTYINGKRVMAQRIKQGDRIDLGDSSLTFHVE